MLHLLDKRVRRTNVDDTEIIYLVEWLVAFVRCAQSTLILIEEEVLSIGDIGFREMVGRSILTKSPRIGSLNGFPDCRGFGRGLDGRRLASGESIDVGLMDTT